MELAKSFRQPPRTAMEVFSLLPEGTLCEVIENQLYMSPSPNRKHQRLSIFISTRIFNFLAKKNSGEVYVAPIDVFLDSKNAFQPDIVFVSNENSNILSDRGIEGAPDLVIEILSTSNEKHDTVKKKAVYERCGVKEFWLVDPKARNAYGFQLSKGKYKSIGKPFKKISFRIFDLTIDLSKEL